MKLLKISLYALIISTLLQINNCFTQKAPCCDFNTISIISTSIAGASFYIYHIYLKRSKRFERSLRKEYAHTFNNLKKAFHFSNSEWNETIKLIKKAKNYVKTHIYNNHNIKVFHDYSLGQDIIRLTKKCLTKYGINPHCIHIKKLSKNNHYSGEAYLHISFSWNTVKGKIKNIQFYTKQAPVIYLKEDLQTRTKEEQLSIISHEVMHLVEQHSTESIMLEFCLEKKGYTRSKIRNQNAWQDYLEIGEKCADLLPCTHDDTVAQSLFKSLKKYCCNNPEAKIKYDEHPTPWSQYQWMKAYIQI